jgi:hypothetical protein
VHLRASGCCRFTPGALAPVRVIVSRSIRTYSAPSVPLASTSRFHRHGLIRDVLAVRRTSTPRRPTSGSVLSLAVLYRHVALQDPGKPAGCSYPVLHRPRWPSTFSDGLGTSITLHPPILVEESISRLNYGSHALQPADLLAPLSEQTRLSPSLRGLLHPGFRRIGRPHRRRISLQWQLGKFHRRDLHPLERQLASLQPKSRLIMS